MCIHPDEPELETGRSVGSNLKGGVMLDKVKEGWVVVLRKGLNVYKYAANKTVELDADATVIVENVRVAMPGSEDDHFAETFIADVRPVRVDDDGTLHYDHQAEVWMFCQYGDFHEKYIQEDLTVLHKWRRTYVPWN